MVQNEDVAETRPRSNFPESRIVFSRQCQLSLTPKKGFLWLAQNILVQQLNHATTYASSAC